jgi:hypothetical protein
VRVKQHEPRTDGRETLPSSGTAPLKPTPGLSGPPVRLAATWTGVLLISGFCGLVASLLFLRSSSSGELRQLGLLTAIGAAATFSMLSQFMLLIYRRQIAPVTFWDIVRFSKDSSREERMCRRWAWLVLAGWCTSLLLFTVFMVLNRSEIDFSRF